MKKEREIIEFTSVSGRKKYRFERPKWKRSKRRTQDEIWQARIINRWENLAKVQ